EVQMSHKEYEILKYLWQNKNNTVSRDSLLNDIWGYEESPTTRTVDNFILKLRQKIETDPNHPKIILTVHGIGYKLITG
ncbi:MAG: winged helix family transcriptional regulator, partial [Chlorobiota bacterium]